MICKLVYSTTHSPSCVCGAKVRQAQDETGRRYVPGESFLGSVTGPSEQRLLEEVYEEFEKLAELHPECHFTHVYMTGCEVVGDQFAYHWQARGDYIASKVTA
jgi:hypothetical protein